MGSRVSPVLHFLVAHLPCPSTAVCCLLRGLVEYQLHPIPPPSCPATGEGSQDFSLGGMAPAPLCREPQCSSSALIHEIPSPLWFSTPAKESFHFCVKKCELTHSRKVIPFHLLNAEAFLHAGPKREGVPRLFTVISTPPWAWHIFLPWSLFIHHVFLWELISYQKCFLSVCDFFLKSRLLRTLLSRQPSFDLVMAEFMSQISTRSSMVSIFRT